ncbi:hypothetical protein ACSSS7_006539 [Eimeria intestinalis]
MPHNALALSTVLAALGAKAASSGFDPTVFLSPLTAKGTGTSLVALTSSKAAAAAAPAAAANFLFHGGGDATAGVGNHAASFLAAKGGASGALGSAGGKGVSTAFLAKGHGVGGTAAATSLAKVGGGGGAKAALLKVSQKTVLARRKVGLAKAGKGAKGVKGVKGKKIRKVKKAGKGRKGKGKRKVKKAKAESENTGGSSRSSGGSSKGRSIRRHLERNEGDMGGGGGGGGEMVPGDGGAAAPPAPGLGPEGEAMPGALGQAGGSAGGAGFLQVKQTAVPSPPVHAGPTPTTTTVTTAPAPSGTPAATATTAATAAAAAAAAKGAAAASPDQIAEGASALHQSAADGASNAAPVYAAPTGADQSGLQYDSSLEDAEEPSSSGGGLLRSFVRGAMGSEDDVEGEGAFHEFSRSLGGQLFGGVGARLTAAKAALTGGAGAGAAGLAMQGLVPSMDPSTYLGGGGVDPSVMGTAENVDVKEEAMGVASLLPLLMSKLSFSAAEAGAVRGRKQQRGREEVAPLQKSAAASRGRSVASTACGSEGGCCSDASTAAAEEPSLTSQAARTVARSHAKGRSIFYRDFLC